ncbi:MAG: dipeptide epimerase [Candidatus Phosphoribacter sp.]
MPVVGSVHARALSVPLHTPFVTALRRTSTIDTLLVEVRTDDGITGLGEAPQVWAVTGESVAGAAACVQQVLAPLIVGRQLDDWADIAASLAGACARNFGAKAAVETGLLDALARSSGLPFAHLLADIAGLPRPLLEVPTDVTVSAGEPNELARAAVARVAEGFGRLKLKVGTDAATDVARVAAVRAAVGPDIGIRLDANQGWTPEQAVDVIVALTAAGLGIELVEQPVPADDVEGLAWVRQRADVPIMADETVYGERELERVIRLGAADAVNVKLAKCGGPLTALRMLRRAREAGLGTMVGSMMESHVGVAAAASVVAAVGTSSVSDLDAAWWTAASPYVGGPSYERGMVKLPTTPGLGISAPR